MAYDKKMFDVISGDVKIYFVHAPNEKSYCKCQDDVYKKIKEMNWPKFELLARGVQSVWPYGVLKIKHKLSSLIIYNKATGILRIFDSMHNFIDQLDHYCDAHPNDDIYVIDVDAEGNFIAQYMINTTMKYSIVVPDKNDSNEQKTAEPNADATKDIIQSIVDGDTTRIALTSSEFPAELIRNIVTEYFINAKVSYDCTAEEYTVIFTMEE